MNSVLFVKNVLPAPMVLRVYSVRAEHEDVLLHEQLLMPQAEFDLGNVLLAGNYRVAYYNATVTPEHQDSGRFDRGNWHGTPGDAHAGRPANKGYQLENTFLTYTITVEE